MTIFCVQRVGERKSQSFFDSKELEGENRNLFFDSKELEGENRSLFLIPKSWRAKMPIIVLCFLRKILFLDMQKRLVQSVRLPCFFLRVRRILRRFVFRLMRLPRRRIIPTILR